MKIVDVVFLFQMQEQNMIQWHGRRHAHPEPQFEFHYFVSGAGVFRNGSKSHSIDRGSLHLSVPGQVHEILAEDLEDPLSYYAILFEVASDDPLGKVLADPQFQAFLPAKIGTSHRMFFEDAKNRFNQSENPHRARAVELRLEALVLDLLGDFESAGPPRLVGVGSEDGFNLHVEQALGILQTHVFGQVTLGALCEQLKITEEHLIRLFKRQLGMTPMRYLSNLKLETATSLLLNSDLSVKEISWKLGYSSPYHFSRSFKVYSGATPTEYRANYFSSNPTNYHMKLLPSG